MNMNMTISASFNEADIKELVKQELERQGYVVEKVTVTVGKRTVGHQMNSYEEAYLKEVVATMNRKKKNEHSNPNKHGYIDYR